MYTTHMPENVRMKCISFYNEDLIIQLEIKKNSLLGVGFQLGLLWEDMLKGESTKAGTKMLALPSLL